MSDEWNPMHVIEAAETSDSAEVKAAGAAVIAYLTLLFMPPSSMLRASPLGQSALSSCRDLVSSACSVDGEVVQDACELLRHKFAA